VEKFEGNTLNSGIADEGELKARGTFAWFFNGQVRCILGSILGGNCL